MAPSRPEGTSVLWFSLTSKAQPVLATMEASHSSRMSDDFLRLSVDEL